MQTRRGSITLRKFQLNYNYSSNLSIAILQLQLETSIDDERQFITAKRPQAPGDATVRKRFSCDNFVIFRRRWKRIAFFAISEFFYMCLYANFQFSWWSRDHFLAPFRGLYLPNVWSQTLQTSKRHTPSVSAFHRYHWFGGKTVSCGLCAG